MKRLTTVVLFIVCVLVGATILQSVDPAQLAKANQTVHSLMSPQVPSKAELSFGSFDQPLIGDADIEAVIIELLLRNRQFINKPGWFHYEISSYSGINKDKKREYDGKSLTDMFSDRLNQSEWFHILNDQGEFVEYFFLTKDKENKELQRAVIGPDGKGGNLTLLRKEIKKIGKDEPMPETPESQPVTIASQMKNILIVLDNIKQTKHQMRGWQDQADGQPVFILEIEIQADKLITYPEYSQPSNGTTVKYVIDLETGQLRTSESWVNLTNGEKVLEAVVEFVVAEHVAELPEKVAKEYSKSLDELATYKDK